MKLLCAFDLSLNFKQEPDQVYSVLFDITYLWEEYLATMLKLRGFEHPRNKVGVGALFLDRDQSFLAYPDFYRLSPESTVVEPCAAWYLMPSTKRYDTYAPTRDAHCADAHQPSHAQSPTCALTVTVFDAAY